MGKIGRKHRYVCESGLRWILNYRRMQQRYISADDFAKNQGWKKLINADEHSAESLNWTIKQSNAIDKLGWHQWFLTTRGPKGFQ